jgi:hypothetical protein
MNIKFVYEINIFSAITIGPIYKICPGASKNLEPALGKGCQSGPCYGGQVVGAVTEALIDQVLPAV